MEVKAPKQSHLEYIETLPEDCIKIDKYLDHEFESLYYSPSNDIFYQAPKIKYRIVKPAKTSISCRSNQNKTVRVSVKKIKKQINGN